MSLSVDETDGSADRSAGGSRLVRFLKRFGAMYALGLTGVAALGLALAGVLPGVAGLPDLSGLPDADPTVLVAAAALNSAVLLAVAVAVGVALAPRVGLRSHLLARVGGVEPPTALRDELPLAAALGAASFLVVAALDALTAPLVAASLDDLVPGGAEVTAGELVGSLAFRLLYGGVTEELLLRFGFMTALLWATWAVARRVGVGGRDGSVAAARPARSVAWVAILLAAVVFGLGHLPALAAATALTPVLVVRTVLLNVVAGVAFGWLYWRRSLESAIVAHAAFHVALVAVSLVVLAV